MIDDKQPDVQGFLQVGSHAEGGDVFSFLGARDVLYVKEEAAAFFVNGD